MTDLQFLSLQVSGIFACFWSVSITAFVFGHVVGIPHAIPNLVLVCLIAAFVLNPFKFFYYKARVWMLKVLVSTMQDGDQITMH